MAKRKGKERGGKEERKGVQGRIRGGKRRGTLCDSVLLYNGDRGVQCLAIWRLLYVLCLLHNFFGSSTRRRKLITTASSGGLRDSSPLQPNAKEPKEVVSKYKKAYNSKKQKNNTLFVGGAEESYW